MSTHGKAPAPALPARPLPCHNILPATLAADGPECGALAWSKVDPSTMSGAKPARLSNLGEPQRRRLQRALPRQPALEQVHAHPRASHALQ